MGKGRKERTGKGEDIEVDGKKVTGRIGQVKKILVKE